MAAHLIAPITVPGHGLQCVKHGATTPPWRTLSFPTADLTLTGPENADQWDTEGGTVTFATCCIWKATVRFNVLDFVAGPGVIYQVHLNGILVGGIVGGIDTGTFDIEVDLDALDLINRPCGNIWEINAIYVGSVEIINIHFGPTP